MNKVVDGIVGGWQVNVIGTFHTGFPLTINGVDRSGTGARSARATCLVSRQTVYGERNGPAATGGGYLWFDPTAFSVNSPQYLW